MFWLFNKWFLKTGLLILSKVLNNVYKILRNIRLSWNKLREFLFYVSSLYQAKVYLKNMIISHYKDLPWLKPNSWPYNFFEVSGHNLDSSQTWWLVLWLWIARRKSSLDFCPRIWPWSYPSEIFILLPPTFHKILIFFPCLLERWIKQLHGGDSRSIGDSRYRTEGVKLNGGKKFLSRREESCHKEATVYCIVCSTLTIITLSPLHCTASMRSAYALFMIQGWKNWINFLGGPRSVHFYLFKGTVSPFGLTLWWYKIDISGTEYR